MGPAVILAAASTLAGFSASDRAALDLAIAMTRFAPPDLKPLIVAHRTEFLSAVREAIHRPPPEDPGRAAAAVAAAISKRTPFAEVVRDCGAVVGALIAAEAPGGAGGPGFEDACAGPYRFPGVAAAAAAGDTAFLSKRIGEAGKNAAAGSLSGTALAGRIVSDGTNALWSIWIAAGGDRRPARKYDERTGPYDIPAAVR